MPGTHESTAFQGYRLNHHHPHASRISYRIGLPRSSLSLPRPCSLPIPSSYHWYCPPFLSIIISMTPYCVLLSSSSHLISQAVLASLSLISSLFLLTSSSSLSRPSFSFALLILPYTRTPATGRTSSSSYLDVPSHANPHHFVNPILRHYCTRPTDLCEPLSTHHNPLIILVSWNLSTVSVSQVLCVFSSRNETR